MDLSDVKCFLLDMDGTFYLGGNLIEGSLEFIDRVLATGRDFMLMLLRAWGVEDRATCWNCCPRCSPLTMPSACASSRT